MTDEDYLAPLAKDRAVPHVIVKLWPGKSDQQKSNLAETITRGVTDSLGYDDDAVSVAFEEVAAADWTEQVYNPDILGKWNDLAKQPGYGTRPTNQEQK